MIAEIKLFCIGIIFIWTDTKYERYGELGLSHDFECTIGFINQQWRLNTFCLENLLRSGVKIFPTIVNAPAPCLFSPAVNPTVVNYSSSVVKLKRYCL